METEILKFILTNQGAVNTEELVNLGDSSRFSENDKFVTCLINRQPKVVARSQVRLCRLKDCQGCRGLHLCKNFLYSGSCHFGHSRRGCMFSHDLHSVYNVNILREFGLEALNRTELCLLLLQSDYTLLPSICHNYNNGVGVNGQCRDDCQRLHVCVKYLSGDCCCFRTHDFYAPQPLKCLREKHIPDNLFTLLKSVYANKEALRLTDRSAGWGNRGNRGNRSKTEICMFFIRGHCKHEDRCFKAHDKMPYRWEIKQDGKWTPMADNEKIEQDYCDPKNTYSNTCPPVHFDTMMCGKDEVRRLSTTNSVLEPDFIHTTDWLWYWEDEYGKWYQYAAVTSEHRLASITSKELEEMYVKNDKDVVKFKAGSQAYELSFQDMIQTNEKYHTKRLVKRRPQFVSAADVQTKRKRPPHSTAVPDYWDKTQILQTGFKRVSLQSSSGEYKEIQELFCNTMSGFDILKIERIQNKSVWEAFQLHKNHMKNNNRGQPVTEKKLFHGTVSKYVDTICATNFDWRLCGVNGTAYGQGSYFARDARYSHNYTGDSDDRFMFVSRVLVGDYTNGRPEYKRPPSKDGGDVNLYNSCVDNITNPSIFVVFEKQQIYPEYLLQYEEKGIHNVYQFPPSSTAAPAMTSPPAVTAFASTSLTSATTSTAAPSFTPRSTTTSASTFTPRPATSSAPTFTPRSTTTSASTYTPRSTTTSAPTFTPRSTTTSASTYTPRSTTTSGYSFTPSSMTTSGYSFTPRSMTTSAPTFTASSATSYTTSATSYGTRSATPPKKEKGSCVIA